MAFNYTDAISMTTIGAATLITEGPWRRNLVDAAPMFDQFSVANAIGIENEERTSTRWIVWFRLGELPCPPIAFCDDECRRDHQSGGKPRNVSATRASRPVRGDSEFSESSCARIARTAWWPSPEMRCQC